MELIQPTVNTIVLTAQSDADRELITKILELIRDGGTLDVTPTKQKTFSVQYSIPPPFKIIG